MRVKQKNFCAWKGPLKEIMLTRGPKDGKEKKKRRQERGKETAREDWMD